MMNAAFSALKADSTYEAMNVAHDKLAPTFDRLRREGVRGLNITMPFKTAVRDLLDSSDPRAERIRAVNTVSREGGVYRGYNTDVDGILGPLRARGVSRIQSAAVIGAGGAARAFCAAMQELRCNRLLVIARDPVRAESLSLEMTQSFPSMSISPARIGGRVASDFQLLFNASPEGSEGVPTPQEVLDLVGPDKIVFDAVYSPSRTALIEAAEASGATAIRGEEMLLDQAIQALRIWTGLEPPREVMRLTLSRFLEEPPA
ncbi:MAG: hypothetical protein HY247_07250 [archaeon]|nr:MAG: hypothetical protein HY247_07250 [archaeon]